VSPTVRGPMAPVPALIPFLETRQNGSVSLAVLEHRSHDVTFITKRERDRALRRARKSRPDSAWRSGSDRSSAKPKEKPKGDRARAIPVAFDKAGVFLPELVARLSARQAEQAHLLLENGLPSKARRHAWCCQIGRKLKCRGEAQHKFFSRNRCYLRYCSICGPACFRALFLKHSRLRVVVDGLLTRCDVGSDTSRGAIGDQVLAKIDFTVRNIGSMPTKEAVRQFNEDIRKFFRQLELRLGISRREYGVLWACEFGSGNSNLHAHGVYCGPRLPQSKARKELSALWTEIRGERSFVSIKNAPSFEIALSHALKYPSKFFDASPARLVDLEIAFDHVRRVHALAAFYNPKIKPEPGEDSHPGKDKGCPICGDDLLEECGDYGHWCFVDNLKNEGRRDLEEVRSTVSVRQADHERRVTAAMIGDVVSVRQAVALAGESDVGCGQWP
jgi:hypothetical protein